MFTSGLWRSFCGLVLLLFVSCASIVWADETDDLATAIVAHIREHLPAGAPPLAAADENRVITFLRYIQRRFYFPLNTHDLQSAAFVAIDSTDPASGAAGLTQAAMTGVIGSLGHGVKFLTTLGSDAPAEQGGAVAPSSRQVGSLIVVALPNMSVTTGNTAHTCADFVRYFSGKTEGRITGVVLDLRGNDSGSLPDSSCLAGLFFKKPELLFQVMSKQGEMLKYESKPAAHIDLPLAVLIDRHTDNAGLLVAAVLQDQHRALILGEQKSDVNGAVSSLLFPPGLERFVVLPTGEIFLPNKQPLVSGVHLDATMPPDDADALLGAAHDLLAQRH